MLVVEVRAATNTHVFLQPCVTRAQSSNTSGIQRCPNKSSPNPTQCPRWLWVERRVYFEVAWSGGGSAATWRARGATCCIVEGTRCFEPASGAKHASRPRVRHTHRRSLSFEPASGPQHASRPRVRWGAGIWCGPCGRGGGGTRVGRDVGKTAPPAPRASAPSAARITARTSRRRRCHPPRATASEALSDTRPQRCSPISSARR